MVLVWALERKTGDEAQQWLDSLDAPLPGAPADDPDFDDSFDQITR